jgi:hypothetical protein
MVKEPTDNKNVAYLLMLLFGIGSLLPWNAVLTAMDFFIDKVRTTSLITLFVDGRIST